MKNKHKKKYKNINNKFQILFQIIISATILSAYSHLLTKPYTRVYMFLINLLVFTSDEKKPKHNEDPWLREVY